MRPFVFQVLLQKQTNLIKATYKAQKEAKKIKLSKRSKLEKSLKISSKKGQIVLVGNACMILEFMGPHITAKKVQKSSYFRRIKLIGRRGHSQTKKIHFQHFLTVIDRFELFWTNAIVIFVKPHFLPIFNPLFPSLYTWFMNDPCT